MSSAPKTKQFLIDRCRFKFSWASGAAAGTPASIEWHRKDVDVAFAEINGLMAGFDYQDEAEPVPLDSRQHPATVSDEDLPPLAGTVIQEYPPVDEPVQGTEHQPMVSQWAAIRGLREETAFHHTWFQRLARNLGDATVSKLLAAYPDAQSIRSKGAQLVKDVLEGFQPRELSLVFAFASFAYAISQLLHKQGRLDKSEILADLKTWRDLIADPRERDAFNLIAQNLWPEAKDHLHFIPIQAPQVGSHLPTPHFPTRGAAPSGGTLAATSQAGGPSLDPSSSILDPAGYGYLGPGNPTSHAHSDNVPADLRIFLDAVDLMNQSHETFDFAALESLNGWFPQSLPSGWQPPPTSAHGAGSQPQRDETTSSGPPDDRGEQGLPRSIKQAPDEPKLYDTGMFLAVLLFVQDVAELVYTLSGRSIASRRQKLYKAEEKDQEAFYLSAQETFFEPRRRCQAESPSPPFRAVLSVAEKFTKSGLLRNIGEIRHYLVSVAAVVFPPGVLFERFLLFVLNDVPATGRVAGQQQLPGEASCSLSADTEQDMSFPNKVKRMRNCDQCSATYSNQSSLRKHKLQEHVNTPPIPCGHGDCSYGNRRLDRVRCHFLKCHPGVSLPERLRPRGRSASSSRTSVAQGE